MEYIVAAESDIGIAKSVNQDSLCVKVAETELGNAALLLICDGMGGLAMGELASAEVVQSFSEWFENEFPKHLRNFDREDIARQVAELLSSLNEKLIAYGEANRLTMGTTATGMIIFNQQYLSFHVGDTRIYKVSHQLSCLTEDHTFVNREVKFGRMTPQQAEKDPRRNALTQCIGAAGGVSPDIHAGTIEIGANYMICSDGLRHLVSDKEIFEELSPRIVTTKTSMQARLRELIECVKSRGERDNISALGFRAEL